MASDDAKKADAMDTSKFEVQVEGKTLAILEWVYFPLARCTVYDAFNRSCYVAALANVDGADRPTWKGTYYPKLGWMVETINDITPPENSYWKLLINNESAKFGVSSQMVSLADNPNLVINFVQSEFQADETVRECHPCHPNHPFAKKCQSKAAAQ